MSAIRLLLATLISASAAVDHHREQYRIVLPSGSTISACGMTYTLPPDRRLVLAQCELVFHAGFE